MLRGNLSFDVAHLLAGSLVLASFMQLYQDRLYALLNIYALHALVLAASVAWQAFVQDAPHLYLTATIALVFKAIVIPTALHRIIVRLGIHREIETVVGVGPAMLFGIGLVALSMVVMLRVTAEAGPLARDPTDTGLIYAVYSLMPYAEVWRRASDGGNLLRRLDPISLVAGGAFWLLIVLVGGWLARSLLNWRGATMDDRS